MEQALAIGEMTQAQNERIGTTVGKERKRLLDFIRRRVPLEEAEDILQDVLFQFVGASRVETINEASSWLYRVAGNKIIDWYRKRKTLSLEEMNESRREEDDAGLLLGIEDVLFDPSEEPDAVLLRRTVWQMLEEALGELPEDQRNVFVWHELEGRSFKEIAEVTGEPLNTLLSRKRYAVMFLRERLRTLYNELLED
jgi:RNA polymerase sigma factor (sigma-70 family)